MFEPLHKQGPNNFDAQFFQQNIHDIFLQFSKRIFGYIRKANEMSWFRGSVGNKMFGGDEWHIFDKHGGGWSSV